jgi:D-alanine-D-alanine ligase
MSKIKTKHICKTLGINVLEEIVLTKPSITENFNIKKVTENLEIKYPVFIKPANLGSSIGIAKATNLNELQSAILQIFKLDTQAIIEPIIENIKEYNIAVIKNTDDEIITSVIETPLNKNNLLDFKEKYLAKDGCKKSGPTKLTVPTEGLLSMGREYNPQISKEMKLFIENSAKKLFAYMGATGNPRIDFLCNSKTGEIWLNEVNPIPGSFGFYLWEKSKYKINYSKLISIIIENGFKNYKNNNINIDLKTSSSRIFK